MKKPRSLRTSRAGCADTPRRPGPVRETRTLSASVRRGN